MNAFEPHCLMTWAEQVAGADDQLSFSERGTPMTRTVDSVLKELNSSLAALSEMAAMPMPLDEMTLFRKAAHEHIAAAAIAEAQSIQDARVFIERLLAA